MIKLILIKVVLITNTYAMSELSEVFNKNKLVSSIKTINDVLFHANEIVKNVQLSCEYDPICEITVINEKASTVPYKSKQTGEPKHVISGSKAVTTFLELLRDGQKKALVDGVKGCGPFLKLAEHFKPGDIDIFFLDSKEVSRIKYENVDVVHIKTQTITEHLDNFDLSCCKTSMNLEGTKFWISLHCLYTMLTGSCFIPKYLQSREKFRDVYFKANNISTKRDFETFYESKDQTTDKCTMMFKRINERIQKYKDRGYTFQYIETDKALSWLTSNNMNNYMDCSRKSVKLMYQ